MELLPNIYSHISNFCISFILYIIFGYIGLLSGMKVKHLLFIGTILIIINISTELFISFLNTLDLIDAYYGIIGVFIGFIFLFVAQRKGLNKNELYENNSQMKI